MKKTLILLFLTLLPGLAQAKKCVLLNAVGGTIVQKLDSIGTDTYEVTFNNINPHAPPFRIALESKTTKFESAGRLGWSPQVYIDIDTQKKIDVKLKNGFSEKMPFYVESAECKQESDARAAKGQKTESEATAKAIAEQSEEQKKRATETEERKKKAKELWQ